MRIEVLINTQTMHIEALIKKLVMSIDGELENEFEHDLFLKKFLAYVRVNRHSSSNRHS